MTDSPAHGVLLLDKPLGMSSSQALQRVRHWLGRPRAGHTGALDPLATGMLPLCFGEATKIAGILLGARKAYRATLQLGIRTDTDDAEGAIVAERPVPPLHADTVQCLLQEFVGTHAQQAPVYSALKQQGQPLYRRARAGETVQAPVREVSLYRVELLALQATRLSIELECGSGYYVRALARDVGERLGCGAHVLALRRTWVEPFDAQPMHELAALQSAFATDGPSAILSRLLPIGVALSGWPQQHLDAQHAAVISHGGRVPAQGAVGQALLLDAQGVPLALAEVEQDQWRVLRGFACRR